MVDFHRRERRLTTLIAVHPAAHFGAAQIEGTRVAALKKAQMGEGWINGNFFVFEPELFGYIQHDEKLEHDAQPRLACGAKLSCYQHPGFPTNGHAPT